MPNLKHRSTELEIMDNPNAPQKELWQNLLELETINTYLGGYKVILNGLDSMQLNKTGSIIDVGSGGGDILRAVAKWDRNKEHDFTFTGLDMNPVMTEYAREHSKSYPEISFITNNVFDTSVDNSKADIVMCSLFCHHFDDKSLVSLLKRMAQLSNRYVIINDLHRHWLAYHSIKILTQLFSRSYMVKNDAPLSVARAFERKDWESTLRESGFKNYKIRWHWAFRWQIIIETSQP